MPLITEPYQKQRERWHQSGRHILAQYDDDSIIVYQAYRPAIGRFAAQHGYFGGEFSFTRMSWIKTNFLWMMYRSGWGTKQDQETTLAVRLLRGGFDTILAQAVPSTFVPGFHATREDWKNALAQSDVRLQWDPDHDPSGAKQERRAVQLGLRGETLARYAREWIVSIEDISGFVEQQRPHAVTGDFARLMTPREQIYPVVGSAGGAEAGHAD